MDARGYLDKYGRDKAREIAESAGTNLAYFEQLACGFRRPSYELAEKLVAASSGEMDTPSLMTAKARIEAAKAGLPERAFDERAPQQAAEWHGPERRRQMGG